MAIKGNKIALDGVDYTEYSDIENFKLSFGLNSSDKSFAYTASEEIVFEGAAYEFLKDKFFSSCDVIETIVEVEIYVAVCDRRFNLQIGYEDISLCYNVEGCDQIKTSVTQLENDCYKYLEETPWLEGFSELEHPILYHVEVKGVAGNLLYLLFPVLAYTLFAITIIFNIFIAFCKAVKIVTFGLSFDCPAFIDLDALVCGLYVYISGNGHKNRVAVVREILEYNMAQCGGTFVSSIFQDSAYKNTVYFSGQNGVGSRNIDEYIPREKWTTDTGVQLLNKLADTFNAEWWLEGDVLNFERVGHREALLPIFPLSLDEIVDLKFADVCVDFDITDKNAFGRFEYSNDSMDTQGNRSNVTQSYDTITEWNPENAEWKRGEHRTTVPFGRARFMFGRESLNDTGYGFALDMDNWRAGEDVILNPLKYYFNAATTNPELDTKANGFSLCGDDARRSRDLLINGDMLSYPKLIVLADPSPTNDWYKDAKVMNTPIEGASSAFADTNSLMYFDEEADFPELYNNFHFTKDPNYSGRDLYNIGSLELGVDCVNIDCEVLDFIANNPRGYRVRSEGRFLPRGFAVPTSTDVQYSDDGSFSTVTMNDLVYNCQ